MMLVRAVLICLTGLLLVYTWILYRDVRYVSGGPGRASDSGRGTESGAGPGAGRKSGEGAPVRCYNLQLEAPKPQDATRSSFRVRENGPGVALREAIGAGAVRYCSAEGKVYRATIVRREGVPDSRFDVLLSSPVDEDDPSTFPVGVAADKGYELPPVDPESGTGADGKEGADGKVGADAKAGARAPDTPYTDAFMIFF